MGGVLKAQENRNNFIVCHNAAERKVISDIALNRNK